METSYISKKKIGKGEEIQGQDIRDGIFNLLRMDFPGFSKDHYISLIELNKYRRLYLTSLISQEKGELAIIDLDVMDAIKNNSILSENIQAEIESELTIGEKLQIKWHYLEAAGHLLLYFFHLYYYG
ncbi:Predicted membrane protein [Chryseobacterium nakagawai]|uniref:hypothetical protein n=1 Tax=Chryseobacterium nakagawai TaxID=1241982 RepID=UPI000F70882E|nr:hypothetical protein [Chryseobacterium nakagawai]VEH19519.1 Predicted membrane protein [Chryseobacterium nakagawai]